MLWKKSLLFLFLGLCLPCAPGLAHDYWIKPDRFLLEEADWVSFDFTAAHEYFGMEENPIHQGFGLEIIAPDGQTNEPPHLFSGHRRAVGEVELRQNGTYLISGVSQIPLFYTQLKGRGMYVSKDKAPDDAIKTGCYLKSVKTFVTVSEPTSETLKSRGYIIELVPQQHPAIIRPGQDAGFQVLFEGKPLAGVELKVIQEGFISTAHGDAPVQAETDSKGIGRLTFPEPGIWIVYCLYEVQTPDDARADFYNYRAYLMLEVQEEEEE